MTTQRPPSSAAEEVCCGRQPLQQFDGVILSSFPLLLLSSSNVKRRGTERVLPVHEPVWPVPVAAVSCHAHVRQPHRKTLLHRLHELRDQVSARVNACEWSGKSDIP